jgi:mycothiol synthase
VLPTGSYPAEVALPSRYEVRPPTIEDVPAIAAVLLAHDLHTTGQPDHDEEFLRDQWSVPGFDPTSDAWVVEGPDRTTIAAAHVMPDEGPLVKSWGVVHPGHRGLGVGSDLLDRIEARAAERLTGVAGAKLHHAINDRDETARAILVARGFGFVRSFRHMQIDLGGPVDSGDPPAGVTLRGIDLDRDLSAVHAVLTEAFEEEWGWRVPPFDRWIEEDLHAPNADPSLWLVAEAHGEIVGATTTAVWGDRAWVATIGVGRDFRRRGIAAALLRRTFALAAERGLARVMLNVDFENPTGAVALYEAVGMRAIGGFDVYEKLLD